ncbi:hypothetical protein GCM10020220_070260 [Nonomuraea rubra]
MNAPGHVVVAWFEGMEGGGVDHVRGSVPRPVTTFGLTRGGRPAPGSSVVTADAAGPAALARLLELAQCRVFRLAEEKKPVLR